MTKEKKGFFAKRETKAYVNPYLAGALLGLVLFAAFFFTGNGLGASGGMNRILVFIEDLFIRILSSLASSSISSRAALACIIMATSANLVLKNFFEPELNRIQPFGGHINLLSSPEWRYMPQFGLNRIQPIYLHGWCG